MRDLSYLNDKRKDIFGNGNLGDKYNGFFVLKIKGEVVNVMASNGGGWEHVSVSMQKKHKIPSWKLMCEIKDMFFYEDEEVMQLHPKKKNYVNVCDNCLHLWRPVNAKIPTPPIYMV